MIEGTDPHADPSPADPPPAHSPTDADPLRAHIDGDPHAFASLVARHQDRLWAIALAMMRNPEDAADALQDAYISAFRRAGSFRGEARVATWLHRVVVNACLDRLRSLKVRAAEPLPTTWTGWPSWVEPSPTGWRPRSSGTWWPRRWRR